MLKRDIRSFVPLPMPTTPRPTEVEIGLAELLAFLRRRRASVILGVGFFLLLGYAYLIVTPDEYTASASLVIDPRKIELFGEGDVLTSVSVPNSLMETEVQILSSSVLAQAIVNNLDLDSDPLFMGSSAGLINKIVGGIFRSVSSLLPVKADAPAVPVSQAERDAAAKASAVRILRGNLEVQRVGLSYALSVSYSSPNPAMSARITNAYLDAYLKFKTDREVQPMQQISKWLQGRMGELQRLDIDASLNAKEKSAFRATYSTFVERYAQALQQESLPLVRAEIINPATPPLNASWPKTGLIVAASVFLGTVFGLGLALMRELLDRQIWSQQQLAGIMGASCLGILPRFSFRHRLSRFWTRPKKPLPQSGERRFVAGADYAISIEYPLSRFAETLRSVKIAADNVADSPVQVLGILSSVPGEGKTTVAINLARVIGDTTTRVLLIDGDLRNPVLSKTLVPFGSPGLLQVIAGAQEIAEVIWPDYKTGLHFLPAGVDTKIINSAEILSSPEMQTVIDSVRHRYDLIILDLPPMISVVDVSAAAHLFDGFAFIVEWGRATSDNVIEALRDPRVHRKLVGALLNKVKVKSLPRLERTHSTRAFGYLSEARS